MVQRAVWKRIAKNVREAPPGQRPPPIGPRIQKGVKKPPPTLVRKPKIKLPRELPRKLPQKKLPTIPIQRMKAQTRPFKKPATQKATLSEALRARGKLGVKY